MTQNVFILGGFQTDFKRNWSQENLHLEDLIKTTVQGLFDQIPLEMKAVNTAHIGNFVGELFCGQGQLGGMLISQFPELEGIPVSRHEAACASGSMAVFAAIADILSQKHQTALVLGVEMMKNTSSQEAANHLSTAAWNGKEGEKSQYMWPYLFSKVYDFYEEHYQINHRHLNEIAAVNLENAKSNPNAQTRNWAIDADFFSNDPTKNPFIEGKIQKSDCGRITDGGAALVLASEKVARDYAKKHAIPFDKIPQIKGWGHTTAPLSLAEKLIPPQNGKYPFPLLKKAIDDAYKQAKVTVKDIDVFETHDCFTISEYVAMEHFGLAAPGEAWKIIENDSFKKRGENPINPSGGLIGLGHPVGASGVRMLLDANKQLTQTAGNYQVEQVNNVCCLNFGGSFTTAASFVVGKNSH